ncbi:hypothetical protein PFISCL1PPCAC_5693 [Pristionchus fissidentatus]|uniref:ShKT domain-containing protein n=1 Tax=Pristionchus fissidentatus TaxID=1538716 RepID=A0AAV5V4S7_9BILA|nr:hypothetical protein PFISCL1PPCAC_5693 [Pristionchus fissidentatus]
MARASLLLLSLSPLLISANEPPLPSRSTAKIDPKTILVLFGTRHGNRNPERFVNEPSRKWGKEGELELTSIGKRQAYGLGKEIRAFVGPFIDSNYIPSQSKFYSSSANRCQMTLQSAVAGIYVPNDWADWNKKRLDNWSPVPYTIDDPLLRMYSVKGCVESDQAWDPISKDTLPDLKELVERSKPLLNYMKEKDGRDATISNAADIADNIINMDFYNATYPDWLANPTLSGYTATTIKKAFLSFAENHMNRCASYKPCRNMMGGLWADHIIKSLDAAAAGTPKTPRLIGYASHTEVTLAVMLILGIQKSELTTSAGFVIELRNNSVPPHVRVLQHDPNPIDAHVIYPAHLVPELSSKSDTNGWMPLSALKEFVARSSFSDWESQCGIDRCSIQAAAQTAAQPNSALSAATAANCQYSDSLSSIECNQLIDTLECSHPHTQSYCARSCFCSGKSIPPPQLNSQSISVSQLGGSPSVISQSGGSPSVVASVPLSYQTFPDGYTASFYNIGK